MHDPDPHPRGATLHPARGWGTMHQHGREAGEVWSFRGATPIERSPDRRAEPMARPSVRDGFLVPGEVRVIR
jgi:hypothetical protein